MRFYCPREGDGCETCKDYMYNVEYGCRTCYARINAFDFAQRLKAQKEKKKDADVAQR